MNDWLANRSQFVLAAFATLAIAGTFALLRLPVSLFPTIEFPRIAIALEAGERPADQMVAQVTRPVEEALRAIPGIRGLRSQTSRGSAEISITFDWGRDMTTAALQAESELGRLAPSLPPGFAFKVRRMDPTIFPVLGYSITSDTQSQVALRRFAQFELRPLLASIEGVAEVAVLGGRETEYQVVSDPARLAALGLSQADVEAAIAADNLVAAVGRFEDRSRLMLTLVDDRLTTVEELGTIVLKSGAGNVVELEDVADVRIAVAPAWTRVTADGRDAVLLNIRQAPEANSLALTDAVKAALREAAPGFPPDTVVRPYYDQSDLVRAAAVGVRDAILIGTLLAGLVLFAFLRSARFVLVVGILLPTTLVSSSLILSALGLSLNIMTLGGMAAAVGLIVDDVVVVLEHIARRLAEGGTDVLAAASEMTRPLIGSSLATIVVFVPLGFLDGVTGGFFRALAVTMAAALALSLLYCLTVVPLMARRFARVRDAGRVTHAHRWLDRLGRVYASVLGRLLRAPRLATLALVGVAAAVGGVSATRLASGFMPQMDEGGFVLDYVAPSGLSLSETDRLVRQLERILQSVPEVDSYSRRTGVQLGGGLSEVNEGDFFVRLKPLPRRSIESIMATVRGHVAADVPGLEIETIQLIGDLIGDLTAVPQPIEVKLYGGGPVERELAADRILDALRGVEGVVEVRKSDRVAGDAVVVRPDRAHLALESLDVRDVVLQLERLVGGVVAGTVPTGEREIGIRVWTPEPLRDRVSRISELELHTADGRLVPVGRVAGVEIVHGQPQLSRENLQPMTAVTGRLEGRDMGSAMREVRTSVRALTLPAGVRYGFGGMYAEQQRSLRDLSLVFVAAICLSALLLLYVFGSLARAGAILGVVGLSIAGVLCGLALTRTELNVSSMMGLTMVVGIVAELGVFYFSELHPDAGDAEARIAAGLARLRPISMSASIAILALAPLALRLGKGAELLAPMAVAIVSGLLVGAPLVLIAGPLLHAALTRRTGS